MLGVPTFRCPPPPLHVESDFSTEHSQREVARDHRWWCWNCWPWQRVPRTRCVNGGCGCAGGATRRLRARSARRKLRHMARDKLLVRDTTKTFGLFAKPFQLPAPARLPRRLPRPPRAPYRWRPSLRLRQCSHKRLPLQLQWSRQWHARRVHRPVVLHSLALRTSLHSPSTDRFGLHCWIPDAVKFRRFFKKYKKLQKIFWKKKQLQKFQKFDQFKSV